MITSENVVVVLTLGANLYGIAKYYIHHALLQVIKLRIPIKCL